MMLFVTVAKAQSMLSQHSRERRLQLDLTQVGLAERAGVSLASLRKFERSGVISLESFLKIQMVLENLEAIVEATSPEKCQFTSIDEVLEAQQTPLRKRGRRK